jgi:hypothetical protein
VASLNNEADASLRSPALQKVVAAYAGTSGDARRPKNLCVAAYMGGAGDDSITPDHRPVSDRRLVEYASKVENTSVAAYDSPRPDVCRLGGECRFLDPPTSVRVIRPVFPQ